MRRTGTWGAGGKATLAPAEGRWCDSDQVQSFHCPAGWDTLIPEIRLLYNSTFPFLKDDQELWNTQSVVRRFHVFTNPYFISPSQDRSAFPWLPAIPELGEWFWQCKGLGGCVLSGLSPQPPALSVFYHFLVLAENPAKDAEAL